MPSYAAMDIVEIKEQILSIHQAIMLLDLHYRLEAVEYLSDCCNDLRLKIISYKDVASDRVLNLTIPHKEYAPFKHDGHFDDLHIPSFCYPPDFDMPVEESNHETDVGDCSVELSDVQINSFDSHWQSHSIELGTNTPADTAVNLVMPERQAADAGKKKSRRKQMFTRKSVRQRTSLSSSEKGFEAREDEGIKSKVLTRKSVRRKDNDIAGSQDGAPQITNEDQFPLEKDSRTTENVPSHCLVCGEKFTNESESIRHRKSCRKKPKLALHYCKDCNLKFRFDRHYWQHLEGHKQNDCKHCSKRFSSKGKYRNHLKKEHPDVKDEQDAIPCKFCPMMFSRLPRLYSHYQLHHSKGKFVCIMCGLFLASKEKYKEHKESHENDMKWECDVCSKKFYSKHILSHHMKRHKSGKYRCLTCNITVVSKRELLGHKRKKHEVQGVEASYECETCHRQFFRKYELQRHLSTHSEDMIFRCQHCDKSFNTIYGLTKHQSRKTHSIKAQEDSADSKYEKIYQDQVVCENCGKQYKTVQQLNNHQRSHKTSYICNTCGATFGLKSNLRRHMKGHEGRKQAICELCGDSFGRVEALREHTINKHSEIRLFVCQQCKKAFKNARELKRHMNTHTMTRPFVCFCGRDYKQATHLRKHQKTAHLQALPPENDLPTPTTETPLLSIGHFDDRDYRLQEAVANYEAGIEYEDVAINMAFGEDHAVSPAVDMTMMNMAVPDSKPEAAMPLVNLSEHIVQEYLLNLP